MELTQTGNLKTDRLPRPSGTKQEKHVAYRSTQPKTPERLSHELDGEAALPDQPVDRNRDHAVKHAFPSCRHHLEIHLHHLKTPGPILPFQLVARLELEERPHFTIGDQILIEDEDRPRDEVFLARF